MRSLLLSLLWVGAAAAAEFRSPLLFDDGTAVAHAAEWPRRRAEIEARWHAAMGAWPAPVEHPQYTVLERTERDGLMQEKAQVEIAPGRLVPGFLLKPTGPGPHPAVLVPFYTPETSIGLGKPRRAFAYELARRGFVTLSIGAPGGDAFKPDLAGATCQPLSYLAYVAGTCANLLANLPEVDPRRLGIIGHSYGGKWAMFGACLNQRFACGAWSDPGIVWDETHKGVNYYEAWYLGAEPGLARPRGILPYTGAYRTLRAAGRDLTDLHALMAPRPFHVSSGDADPPSRAAALEPARAVYRLLGFTDRIEFTTRPAHEPTEESNAAMYAFLERWLKQP